jgi:hypothetical protein
MSKMQIKTSMGKSKPFTNEKKKKNPMRQKPARFGLI